MIWLLLLVAGVIAYIVILGITKANMRLHYVNQKRAFRLLETASGQTRLPKWGRDTDKMDTFFQVIKMGGIRKNIPPSYVSLMVSTKRSRDLYLTYAAHMETEGSSFLMQQDGCINLLQTMWNKMAASDQCKFIELGFEEIDGSQKLAATDAAKDALEPVFKGKFGKFFIQLAVPLKPSMTITEQEADQCGYHVLLYLAHNPEEAVIFMEGVREYGDPDDLDAAEAAHYEVMMEHIEGVRLTSYRAIVFIMDETNPTCFSKVDRERTHRLVVEAERSPGAWFLNGDFENTTLQSQDAQDD